MKNGTSSFSRTPRDRPMPSLNSKWPKSRRTRPCRRRTRQRSSILSSRSDELMDVLAEDVGLQVYRVAHRTLAQRGDFVGVRYDPDAKAFFSDRGHRQADAVHSHRTFEDEITHHV